MWASHNRGQCYLVGFWPHNILWTRSGKYKSETNYTWCLAYSLLQPARLFFNLEGKVYWHHGVQGRGNLTLCPHCSHDQYWEHKWQAFVKLICDGKAYAYPCTHTHTYEHIDSKKRGWWTLPHLWSFSLVHIPHWLCSTTSASVFCFTEMCSWTAMISLSFLDGERCVQKPLARL